MDRRTAETPNRIGREAQGETVVVTGAAGFLGRHLLNVLREAGLAFVGVDRAAASGPPDGPSERHVVLDLATGDLQALLSAVRPSAIFHLAGPASVPASVQDPDADFHGSVVVTERVLETVRRTGLPCRVVYFSSAAVYGDPPTLPISEDAPTRPLSPYGYHKVITETLIREYARLHGVPGCSMRVFSAYGPGLRRQLLWDVVQKARSVSAVVLNGTGQESRDFVHAVDVARAALCVLQHGEFDGGAYNIASGTETTVECVAASVMSAANVQGRAAFSGQARPGDPARWKADISRVQALGWAPGIAFADGVAEYVDWVDSE